MAHRIYLYNFDSGQAASKETQKNGGFLNDILAGIGSDSRTSLLMTEWNYELPLFLYPLFYELPLIGAPLYNGFEGGIYAPAKPGIIQLKAFYDLVERHADALIQDKISFDKHKQMIFNFLDSKVIHNSFHLDAWDVFNMDDQSHKKQATKLLLQLQTTNSIIQSAIDQDDPTLLDSCAIFKNAQYGFKNFRHYLNDEGYQYGWAVMTCGGHQEVGEENEADHPDQFIFEENGLSGLRSTSGQYAIPPKYDEVYYFPEGADFTVVRKDRKYGYVNSTGTAVVPPTYHIAYELINGTGIVMLNGKFGLIHPETGFETKLQYDVIHHLSLEPFYFSACKDGFWGVINANGDVLLPYVYEEELHRETLGNYTYYCGRNKNEEIEFFFQDLKKIGQHKVKSLKWGGYYEGSHLFILKSFLPDSNEKLGKVVSLIDQHGKTILPAEYEKIKPKDAANYIVKKDGKYGLFNLSRGFLLLCIYDKIKKLNQDIFRISLSGKTGLFDAKAGHQVYIAPQFDSFSCNINRNEDQSWEALAFHENKVFSVRSDQKITPVNQVQAGTLILSEAALYKMTVEQKEILTTLAVINGEADDLYNLGCDALETGDEAAAIDLYLQSAALGNPDAMSNLGYLFSTEGDFYQENKAFNWYKNGAKAGSPNAMNGLGMCYLDGIGVQKNVAQGIHWYQRAAENENESGHRNLAVLYLDGVETDMDLNKAMYHFEEAERLGYPNHGQYALTLFLKDDYEGAIHYYQLSVEEGVAQSAYNLAIMYEHGYGAAPDPFKAIAAYQEAVELGLSKGYLELIRLYKENDQVINKEKAAALTLLAKAAGIEVPEDTAPPKKKGWFR